MFHQETHNAIFKLFIKAGSIPFIFNDIPLFDTPTQIIGIDKTSKSLTIVGSLNKQLSQFHSDSITLGDEDSYDTMLINLIEDCLAAFKSRQMVYPSRLIVLRNYRHPTTNDEFQNEISLFKKILDSYHQP